MKGAQSKVKWDGGQWGGHGENGGPSPPPYSYATAADQKEPVLTIRNGVRPGDTYI